jgi:hypothetical protein
MACVHKKRVNEDITPRLSSCKDPSTHACTHESPPERTDPYRMTKGIARLF